MTRWRLTSFGSDEKSPRLELRSFAWIFSDSRLVSGSATDNRSSHVQRSESGSCYPAVRPIRTAASLQTGHFSAQQVAFGCIGQKLRNYGREESNFQTHFFPSLSYLAGFFRFDRAGTACWKFLRIDGGNNWECPLADLTFMLKAINLRRKRRIPKKSSTGREMSVPKPARFFSGNSQFPSQLSVLIVRIFAEN